MSTRKLTAFISSTMRGELDDEREICRRALGQYGIDVITFDNYGARPESPESAYFRAVEEAHVYIGIYWNSYSEPTNQEYEHAVKLGKPCFLYQKTHNYGGKDPKLQGFLESASARHVIRKFTHAPDLGDAVWHDLQSWLVGLAVESESYDQRNSLRATEAALASSDMLEVYEENSQDRFRFERSLADLLRLARDDVGARPYMAASALPPFISRPWEVQERRQTRVYAGDPQMLNRILLLLQERYALWQQVIKVCDIYLLVDRAAYEQYFRAGYAGTLGITPDETIAQRDHFISLIADNPRYHIGLHEEPVPTTYMICGSRMVTLYGGTAPAKIAGPFTGIRGLRTSHPPTVLRFRLCFESLWRSLASEATDKKVIIEWLQRLRS